MSPEAKTFLAPVHEYYRSHPGAAKSLLLEYNRLTGQRLHRTVIYRWLDPSYQTEPLLGSGLALRKAWENLSAPGEPLPPEKDSQRH